MDVDLDCAIVVGRQLSALLENLKYRQEERRAAERVEYLARATNKLFATSDQNEMLRTVLGVVVEEFADWAVAATVVDNELQVIASAASQSLGHTEASPSWESRVFGQNGDAKLMAALRGQRPILVNEVARSPHLERDPGEAIAPRAWMMAPLFIGHHYLGGIVCYSATRRYDDRDLDTHQELCRKTSLALENAESFARERRLTQTLQRATLPSHLAEVEGALISAVYLPAAEEEQVGGDWYDAFWLDDERVVVTVGDVTGHGLQAAVIMAKLRHALNVVAMYESDPSHVLDVAEQIVLRRFPEAVATAFIAVINAKRKTLTWANAGHPYPIVRHRNGSIVRLAAAGLPIGLRHLGQAEAPSQLDISDVELMVLFTDGLTEAERNEIEGDRRVVEAATQDAIRIVSDSAEFIKRACLGGPPRDDVAILALNFVDADRWRFESNDPPAAQKARFAFRDQLRSRGLSQEDCITAEIIFGELAANVARHAPGPVEAALEWKDGRPILHMVDSGKGYDPNGFAPVDMFAESGRGLWLIRRLGGTISASVHPGIGTHTQVALPVELGPPADARATLHA